MYRRLLILWAWGLRFGMYLSPRTGGPATGRFFAGRASGQLVANRGADNTGALIITYYYLGGPSYNYSIMGPKTQF